jgi:hypothetical protein
MMNTDRLSSPGVSVLLEVAGAPLLVAARAAPRAGRDVAYGIGLSVAR